MSPSQVISPQNTDGSEPAPSAVRPVEPPQPASGKPFKKIIIIVVAIVVLALLAGGAYAYNQKHVTTKKFNQLAADIKKQELDGLTQYAKAASITNDFGNMINLATGDNPPANVAQQLTDNVATLKSTVNTSCSDKTSDLTAAKIDARVKDLKLNADQQKYVTAMKGVMSSLQSTSYTNTGMCADGPVFVSFADNFAKLMPGLIALEKLSDNPTPAQIDELKKYAGIQLSDDAGLKTQMPQAWQLLEDIQGLISDTYNILNAGAQNNFEAALKYETQLESLAGRLQKDTTGFTDEANSLDKTEDAAATKASLAEISAIEYQKSHGSNPNMQLDLAVPSFRIADASLTDYSDIHEHYPAGTSAADIASLDDNMQTLKNKDLLKNLTYTSLGSDNSGFSLSAKLANGTTVSERLVPSQQSA